MAQIVNIHYLMCRHTSMMSVRCPCDGGKPLFSKEKQMHISSTGEITGHPIRKSKYSLQHYKGMYSNKFQCFMSLKYSAIWEKNSVCASDCR
ncbi:hypothetical protein TNCT_540871 [Trichonephila clavata]|uniref:Uncharacterized protein n=1 Tax=Trichonephila clavata TaxID=2740835 RepID=A0A8X6GFK6_TRICU|nr:hypothetical protein TNCT_540871 [Trichonephila clavata]